MKLARRIKNKLKALYFDKVTRPAAINRTLASQEEEMRKGLLAQEKLISAASFSQKNVDISILRDNEIPQLAWLCTRSEDEGYSFVAGRSVEIFKNGIFEGVWAGDFGDLKTAATAEVYGSGVLFDQPHPLFIQRKDVREFIYILRDKHNGVDYLSNSFNFILARAGISRSDELFAQLSASLVTGTFQEGRKGLHHANPKVAETDQYEFYRPFYSNFRFRSDGTISFEQMFLGRDFRDFEDYKSFLLDITKRTFENGSHPDRRKPLTPLTSISSGYDSTGVSVLAKECGCDEAITIRVSVYDHQDSGEEIANALGFKLQVFQHFAGDEIHNLKMAAEGGMRERLLEFIATSGIGDDSTFSTFESVLDGRIFLSGVGGDATWDKHYFPKLGLPVEIRMARSLTEFRLRVGFAHFGPILAASVSASSIVRLSNSPEMEPFSLGVRYDRPIPRRLVEEAGVARELFGMEKSATAPDFVDGSDLWDEAVERIMERYV